MSDEAWVDTFPRGYEIRPGLQVWIDPADATVAVLTPSGSLRLPWRDWRKMFEAIFANQEKIGNRDL